MKWGSVNFFALILSLLLNAGILWLGFAYYQSQQLLLSQVAGSQSTMEFTLEIVSSQNSQPLPESGQSLFAKEKPQIESIAAESFTPVVASSAENEINIKHEIERDIKHEVEQDIQQDISQKILMPEQRDSSASPEVGSEAIKPISKNQDTKDHSETKQREKAAEQSDNKHNKPAEASQATANVAARSGDQFAAELATTIHAKIQGCYPESSKRRGEEGVVKLKIVKHQDGLSVEMVESSGFKRLDRCAISAVEKLLRSINVEEVPASGIYLKPIRFQLR